MIRCAECGKPLEKVPLWFETVAIRFVCDNCRKVNPSIWLSAAVDEEEEKILPEDDQERPFVEGEVSLEELAEEDRKRLLGDDLFDTEEEEPEAE
ncbi:MAG: hypothetical protein N2045_08045 [Fimbriimonadales bacterium]|jgi:phage FluMu protein Com|nr:hypothetical protein [Armatimonadota bacterium]MCX7687905.1 hypothetical protein [Fimbriimonadales bacterium]CUU06114.1 hypothetical protein GBSOP10_104515 [Armatimonadetes bacterium GBS]CUU34067.1 hypothetical protein GXSOP10_10962 [Armatimonadetes bacterium GXS]CUU37431.1 hypothetical protein DCOP10_12022 [Armatimonadetes bacterium DC]GBC90572.1 hypothetical protein HRbin14_01309 [bacterium HR14]